MKFKAVIYVWACERDALSKAVVCTMRTEDLHSTKHVGVFLHTSAEYWRSSVEKKKTPRVC